MPAWAREKRMASLPVVILDGRAGLDDHAVSGQPFLGQHAEGAIGELDEVLALARGRQQPRQGDDLIAELHGSGQIEPVDAGGDGDAEIGGGAVELALGLDDPALANQRGHDGGQEAGGEFVLRLAGVGIDLAAESEVFEDGQGAAFGRFVAEDHFAAAGS